MRTLTQLSRKISLGIVLILQSLYLFGQTHSDLYLAADSLISRNSNAEKQELNIPKIEKDAAKKLQKQQTGIICRSSIPSPTEMLIIMEGQPVEKAFLDNFRLREIKTINYLSPEMTSAIYGERGKFGVIAITLKRRARRKLRKMNSF